ncbi:MAG: pentapeptide repeat-containing protein [Phormidesmis sp.]
MKKTLEEDLTYTVIRKWLLGTITSNGGRFCGADLSGADFSFAQLKGANFSNSKDQTTKLRHVCWKNAADIHFAKFSDGVLQNRKVRSLLTETETETGYGADLRGISFRGTNLSEIKLEKANLTRAILSDALLKGTNLEGAVLTEVQAVNTDFTGARLTGAVLEAWNIDSTTILKKIDCKFVLLLEHPKINGDYDRRPHDSNTNFKPGDFEKLFKEVQDDVQLLIRGSADPTALRSAFQKIKDIYPHLAEDTFQSFQRRGDDFLITAKLPADIDKGEFQRTWVSGYQAGLQAGRNESAALLASAEKRADGLETIALTIAQNRVIQETTNDYRQTIRVEGNVSDSVIGQGDHNRTSKETHHNEDAETD